MSELNYKDIKFDLKIILKLFSWGSLITASLFVLISSFISIVFLLISKISDRPFPENPVLVKTNNEFLDVVFGQPERIPVIILVGSIFYLIASIGLVMKKEWGRILFVVECAVFSLYMSISVFLFYMGVTSITTKVELVKNQVVFNKFSTWVIASSIFSTLLTIVLVGGLVWFLSIKKVQEEFN